MTKVRTVGTLSVLVLLTAAAGRVNAEERHKKYQDFIDAHIEDARYVNARWGLPVSLILAQSSIESQWGEVTHGANVWFGVQHPCAKVKDPSSVVKVTTKSGPLCFIKHASYRAAAMNYAKNLCDPDLYGDAIKYAKKFYAENDGDPSEFDLFTFVDKIGSRYCPDTAEETCDYATMVKGRLRDKKIRLLQLDVGAGSVCKLSPEPATEAADAPATTSPDTGVADSAGDAPPEDPPQPPSGDPDVSE